MVGALWKYILSIEVEWYRTVAMGCAMFSWPHIVWVPYLPSMPCDEVKKK